jgi:two-component system, LytTR family, response regulator
MIQCLVIDDEQHAIDVLTHYIRQTEYLQLAGACLDPIIGLRMVNELQPDLIFLDIQMPNLSGMDFVKTIDKKFKVILTTAYSEFAAEGFDLDVVDYLMKPVPYPRFLKAVQKTINLQTGVTPMPVAETIDNDYIFVKTEYKGKLLKINLADIDYVEGMKNYVAIYHNNVRTMALLTMKDLEERLPQKYFARVHKSFIVSIPKISTIDGNQVILKNINSEIILGDAYKPSFLNLMKDKLMGR